MTVPSFRSLRKRIILTVTTGRSGTKYLSEVMRRVPNVAAFHEPYPKFDAVMRDVQLHGRDVARSFLIELKLPFIEGVSEPVYIETSHLACKGFIEPLMELGICPDLIVLTRERRDVALSLYRLNTIPERTEDGRRFLLGPSDPGVMRMPGWQDMSDYQLCYWYCREIERRAKKYSTQVENHGGKVVELDVDQLNNIAGVYELIDALELEHPTWYNKLSLHRVLGRRVNRKDVKKRESYRRRPNKEELDSQEIIVDERIMAGS